MAELDVTGKRITQRLEYFDRTIREYEVDGVVMFSNRGGRPMSIGQHELVQLITERHDLPVLIFEGDQANPEGLGGCADAGRRVHRGPGREEVDQT